MFLEVHEYLPLILKGSLVWALWKCFVSSTCLEQIIQLPPHLKQPFSESSVGGGGSVEGMRVLLIDGHFRWPRIGSWGIAFCILTLLCMMGSLSRIHFAMGGFLGLCVTTIGTRFVFTFGRYTSVSSLAVLAASVRAFSIVVLG